MPLDYAEENEQSALLEQFSRSRKTSVTLASAFSPEDWMVQSMEEASPIKWNLAHTSWFYETFVLKPLAPGYKSYDPAFNYLFNSYYQQVGEMHPRPSRGLLSRPTCDEVIAYRDHVDEAVRVLIKEASEETLEKLAPLIVLGCAHEEQHQELLLTDIKHGLSLNPLAPAVFSEENEAGASGASLNWIAFEGGLATVGHDRRSFAFDNEGPRHQTYLQPFLLASRSVTNAEYAAFIEAGGYEESSIWLADGWARVQEENWRAPLYWRKSDNQWREYTLFGEKPLIPDAPVAHLSFYEAAAYAEWTSYRLPTEFEWERASAEAAGGAQFMKDGKFNRPAPDPGAGLRQMFGGVWEWTSSPYVAYPGYRTPGGAIGEYNGKFMSSQMVLRGGSCATPEGHVRATYRNFFPPNTRWQFAGLRLARDL
ncbi:MAG: ergothioneine biosynthesis protein EgtB [Pseudomonadota bacterium]